MNSFTFVGRVLSVAQKATRTGSAKLEITVDIPTKDAHAKFYCVACSELAEALWDLQVGEWILASGRIEATLFQNTKGLSVLLKDASRLEPNADSVSTVTVQTETGETK